MTSREEIVQNHRDHVFFSWVPQQVMTNPIVVDRAKGVYFWDVDGKQYIALTIGGQPPNLVALALPD